MQRAQPVGSPEHFNLLFPWGSQSWRQIVAGELYLLHSSQAACVLVLWLVSEVVVFTSMSGCVKERLEASANIGCEDGSSPYVGGMVAVMSM